LYTVRKFTQTADDLRRTLERVAAIGYRAVQTSALGPIPTPEVARMVRQAGLTVVATHVSWSDFLNNTEKVIEDHRILGSAHAGIGGLPGTYHSEQGLDRFVAELEVVLPKLEAAGLAFSYHNHNHELAHYSGRPWLELLMERTAGLPLNFEIDTYWIQAGGGDPAAWIRRCKGRVPLLHVKDMIVTPQRETRFAEVGEGNLNWPAIFEAAEESGVNYILVEQDNCYERDEFESLAISYRNLLKFGYS
ncbi:MAG: sugar phosphate isomerase/epimerase, partial [Kiritimatiellae bacterium]|nr:sugar phosphate isomerase/epimerase [Kiritimatiellia bacterium]